MADEVFDNHQMIDHLEDTRQAAKIEALEEDRVVTRHIKDVSDLINHPEGKLLVSWKTSTVSAIKAAHSCDECVDWDGSNPPPPPPPEPVVVEEATVAPGV